MIRLTRLNNQVLAVNSDLIKFVENAPDTVITLITGEKLIVLESVDEVIHKMVEFRRLVLEGVPVFGADPGSGATIANREAALNQGGHTPESGNRG